MAPPTVCVVGKPGMFCSSVDPTVLGLICRSMVFRLPVTDRSDAATVAGGAILSPDITRPGIVFWLMATMMFVPAVTVLIWGLG